MKNTIPKTRFDTDLQILVPPKCQLLYILQELINANNAAPASIIFANTST